MQPNPRAQPAAQVAPRAATEAAAKQFVAQLATTPPGPALVFGVSEIWHLPVIAAGARGPVLVFEPDADEARRALDIRAWDALVGDAPLTLAQDLQALNSWLAEHYQPDTELPIFAGPWVRSQRSAALQTFIDTVSVAGDRLAHEWALRTQRSGEWADATLGNLAAFGRLPGLEALQNAAPGATVVVAGAGPSLDLAVESLRKHRDSVILLAVDMAWKALEAAGLTPDLVFAIESSSAARAFIEGGGTGDAGLVASPWVDPALLARFEGRACLAPLRTDRLAQELCALTGHVLWDAPYSVSTLAFQTAQILGPSRIVLVGQDLAWPSERIYARGCPNEGLRARQVGAEALAVVHEGALPASLADPAGAREWARFGEAAALGHLPRVLGVDGRDLPTIPAFAYTIDWFAAQGARALSAGVSLVNASRGAYIDGFAIATPDEALAAASTSAARQQLRGRLESAQGPSAEEAITDWQAQRAQQARRLARSATQAAKAARLGRSTSALKKARTELDAALESGELWGWACAAPLDALGRGELGVADFFDQLAERASGLSSLLRPRSASRR